MAPTLSQILPLIILIVIAAGVGFVLYHVWHTGNKIGKHTSDKMARKNVVLTKDGMRVGIKHVEQERYVDATQSWVVKAWNFGNVLPTKKRK